MALGAFEQHTDDVLDVAFGSDERTLASGGGDRTIQLWQRLLWRGREQLRETVCDVAGGGLSRAEWAQYARTVSYRRSCP